MFHVKRLLSHLRTAAEELGVPITNEVAVAMIAHLELLEKWNAKLNLVGPGTLEHWLTRHTLDSLVPIASLSPQARILDIGSGAGFPGLPIALVRPDCRVWLAERRAKRRAFLQNAVATVKASNVVVIAEPRQAGPVDAVLGRAVLPPAAWLTFGASMVVPGGRVGLFLQGTTAAPQDFPGLEMADARIYKIEGEMQRAFYWFKKPIVPRETP
jgi:16S rRNA (guanine527-N7)-methyltransferase